MNESVSEEQEQQSAPEEEIYPVYRVRSRQDKPLYSLFYNKYLRHFRGDFLLWFSLTIISLIAAVVLVLVMKKLNAVFLLLPIVLGYNTWTISPPRFISLQEKHNKQTVGQDYFDADYSFFEKNMRVVNESANATALIEYSQVKKIVMSREMIALQATGSGFCFFRLDSMQPRDEQGFVTFLQKKNPSLIVKWLGK